MLLKDAVLSPPKILLLGAPGTGKTVLATTLGHRAVVLDLNNGMASARMHKDKWTVERGECEIKKCWGEGGPEAMWKRAVGYVDSYFNAPERPALVVDGLSDLLESSLGNVLSFKGKWTDTNPPKAGWDEWGTAIAQIKRVMWKLRLMQNVVVVVGHTYLADVPVAGEKLAASEKERPPLKEVISCYGKSLPGDVLAGFDEVWFTRVKGFGSTRKWMLQSVSNAGAECKSRRCLEDGSDMNLGMEGLLAKVGWKWEEKEVKK